MRHSLITVFAAVLGAGLAMGCDDSPEGPTNARAGTEPVTGGAVAVVTLEHLADIEREPTTVIELPQDAVDDGVLAEIWTRQSAPEGAGLIEFDVSVENPSEEPRECEEEPAEYADFAGCFVESRDGGDLYVGWGAAEPEEEMGSYYVEYRIADAMVTASYRGWDIEGDPREQDESVIPLDTALALVTDPQLGALVTPDLVAEGEDVAWTELDLE